MEKQASLSRHLKSVGIKSVTELATFGGLHSNTLHQWHRTSKDRKEFLVPLINRYIEFKRQAA